MTIGIVDTQLSDKRPFTGTHNNNAVQSRSWYVFEGLVHLANIDQLRFISLYLF